MLSTWDGTLTWNGAQALSYGASFATITTGTTSNVTKSVTVTADIDALIKNGGANFGWRISEAEQRHERHDALRLVRERNRGESAAARGQL